MKWLVILGQRGVINWLYWGKGNKWAGFIGTEKVNGLVILGQREQMDWLYRDSNWTGYNGT